MSGRVPIALYINEPTASAYGTSRMAAISASKVCNGEFGASGLAGDQSASISNKRSAAGLSKRGRASASKTKTPQGIVALVPLLPTTVPTTSLAGEQAIYLYEIQDPGNLGTILRTLAWFGDFRCLLSPGSVDPYNSKVVRASTGAIFHVPIEIDVELGSLAARFPRIACLDMHGGSLQSPQFRQFDCYLFGNEARGVPREHLASLEMQPFTIPGNGAIESLNLASAVNMCVYELKRERATLPAPPAPGAIR